MTAQARAVDELRVELDRIGVSYRKAGAARYVALHDLGEEVWLRGPPMSGLVFESPPDELFLRVSAIGDDVGPDAFWRALGFER